jgi:hypothetical protein
MRNDAVSRHFFSGWILPSTNKKINSFLKSFRGNVNFDGDIMNSCNKCRYWRGKSNFIQVRRNCLVCDEVMSLVNPLECVVIVCIKAFGVYTNYHILQ